MKQNSDIKSRTLGRKLQEAGLHLQANGLQIGPGMVYSHVQIPADGLYVNVDGSPYMRWKNVKPAIQPTFSNSLRAFLALKETEHSQIIAFARQYGTLTVWRDVDSQVLRDDQFELFGMDDSDPMELWIRYPRKARAMLSIASYLRLAEARSRTGTVQRIFEPSEDTWKDAFYGTGLPEQRTGSAPSIDQRVKQAYRTSVVEQYRILHALLETWIGGMEIYFRIEETNPALPSVPVVSLRISPADSYERSYKGGLMHALGVQLLAVLQNPNRIEHCDVCGSTFMLEDGDRKPRPDKAVICHDENCHRLRHLELMRKRREQKPPRRDTEEGVS